MRTKSVYFLIFVLVLGLLNSCQFTPSSLKSSSDFQIIGGEPAASDEFPFAVNIWLESPDYVAHLCGGSLIHAKWVLTAAHCVMEDDSESTQRKVKPRQLKLYLGSLHHSGEGGRQLLVQSVRVHPRFSWPHNDVALIELQDPVLDVLPVALSHQDWGERTDEVTVVGWGLRDFQGKYEAEALQKVVLPLLPRIECQQDTFPMSRGISVEADMLCAQTQFHSRSSCPGDSGGPLLAQTNEGPLQIGIVSWSSACGGRHNDGTSNAAGYADVNHALPWILSHF